MAGSRWGQPALLLLSSARLSCIGNLASQPRQSGGACQHLYNAPTCDDEGALLALELAQRHLQAAALEVNLGRHLHTAGISKDSMVRAGKSYTGCATQCLQEAVGEGSQAGTPSSRWPLPGRSPGTTACFRGARWSSSRSAGPWGPHLEGREESERRRWAMRGAGVDTPGTGGMPATSRGSVLGLQTMQANPVSCPACCVSSPCCGPATHWKRWRWSPRSRSPG